MPEDRAAEKAGRAAKAARLVELLSCPNTVEVLRCAIFFCGGARQIEDRDPTDYEPIVAIMVEPISRSYVCRVLRLTQLAPDIVERILDGRPTAGLAHLPAAVPGRLGETIQRRIVCSTGSNRRACTG